jgi:hypothetical protein
MKITRFLVLAALTAILGATSGLLLEAQRVPSAGGSFLPSADYDLSGDVRFTASSLTNSQNPVTVGGTQTLTNKTLVSPTITGGTFTPTSFTVAGAGAGTATLQYANTATSGTFTIPSSASDTFVTLAATQTLTGKTLTTPTLTAPVVSTITNTGTLTLPSATGGVPVSLNCGATGSGNQTCSATAATALTKVYAGSSTLSSNSAVITFPVAFAATTSYQCVANDITTRANPVQMVSTSTTTATITNTTGASDVINWICVGQ